MSYKVLDIYKDLPRTNCGDCGKGSCFAFASAVFLDGRPLSECPHVEADLLRQMEGRLERGREQGEGRRRPSNEQALTSLLAQLQDVDLAAQARACGAEYAALPEGSVRVRFLDRDYIVTRDGVQGARGDRPSVWAKIFLLIYLTRATGRLPVGEWVAYRELPNTGSKAKTFEECANRIAERFDGASERLAEAAARLEGLPIQFGSASRSYRFPVLPRVEMMLLFWDREEEFPARVALLLDRTVLDYLDQEALVFMAEAFTERLFGEDLNGVVA